MGSFADAIDRARAPLPSCIRTVVRVCRAFVPKAAVEIVAGTVVVTGCAGVLTLRRETTSTPWAMRLALGGAAWPDDGEAPTDEPSLVAALAAITGCPSAGIASTSTSLRWLAEQGSEVARG